MRQEVAYRIEVRLAWWVRWLYVPALGVLSACGMAPDWDKVEAAAGRAIRVRLVRVQPGVQA